MLEPRSRQLFYEALSPPPGYQLARAIGTTYSLDLLALLAVPLAFTSFGYAAADASPADGGLALLEAVRRHADQVSLFCQGGRIEVPARYRRLIAFLEDCVHEVALPRNDRVFHPKVWVLRFVSEADGRPLYRVLCLTRNLTFAHNWDTILVLEGELRERKNGYRRNRALARLLSTLPSLTKSSLTAALLSELEQMSWEISRVDFQLPEGFADYRFHLLGVPGAGSRLLPAGARRGLIVSPFVSAGRLKGFAGSEGRDVLISRWDQLDALPQVALEQFAEVYGLDPAASEGTDPDDAFADRTASPDSLHAKLYILEDGWDARLWTGSPNATHAGFDGNVELLVELSGRRSSIGIDKVLRATDTGDGLKDLLRPYVRGEPVPLDPDRQAADQLIDNVRYSLGRLPLVGRVSPAVEARPADGSQRQATYRLTIATIGDCLLAVDPRVRLRCWPISLPPDRATDVESQSEELAVFGALSFDALTPFVAFEATATQKGARASSTFVLSAPLQGAPAGRRAAILRSLLANSRDVVRFLLLLLAEAGGDLGAMQELLAPHEGMAWSGHFLGLASGGLLEALLHTLQAAPDKLDAVETLIHDLIEGGDEGLLPPGFAEIWTPIAEVRRKVAR